MEITISISQFSSLVVLGVRSSEEKRYYYYYLCANDYKPATNEDKRFELAAIYSLLVLSFLFFRAHPNGLW
jgi:hypothetical protein